MTSPPHQRPASAPWTEDPEFVQLYDVENAGMWDHDFYRELAVELRAEHVADIGCGTGVLAVELAQRGIRVTGVDPAEAMLDVARARASRAGADGQVTLIQGHAGRLPDSTADLAVMVGHVAQYFLSRAEWDEVLRHAFRTLRTGGHLAFESRNPVAASWDLWDEEHTRETQPHPDGGEFTSWLEVVGIDADADDGDLVTCRGHHILPDGRHVTADEPLRYRPLEVLLESLHHAGFDVEELWGDWDRSEMDQDSPEIIILARKPCPA